MDRYEELARQATWVASKVSSDVHGVDTMVGHLAEGRFKIGAGDTAVMLEGVITPAAFRPASNATAGVNAVPAELNAEVQLALKLVL